MDNLYCIKKRSGNVVVAIMKCKFDRKYHFVNLTKNHVCECAFNTIEDAVADMEAKRHSGEISCYFEIT